MKNMRITYTDGTIEDLEPDWDSAQADNAGTRLFMRSSRKYGPDDRGPTIILANVRKYEWVEAGQ